jgi:AcrR family transcriptional regulator
MVSLSLVMGQEQTEGSEPAGKREQNKAANRAEILKAAREIFTTLGYEAATVRDIIRRTNLASGTFYNYYPDKESIFRALLYDMEERRRTHRRELTRGAKDLEGSLRNGFRAYYEHVAADVEMFELLRRNSGVLGGFFEDPVLAEGSDKTRSLLQATMDRGELPEMDADYLAGAISGISWEIAVRMIRRKPIDVDAAVETATRMAVGGIESASRAARARQKKR